jgi:hypothetical protein
MFEKAFGVTLSLALLGSVSQASAGSITAPTLASPTYSGPLSLDAYGVIYSETTNSYSQQVDSTNQPVTGPGVIFELSPHPWRCSVLSRLASGQSDASAPDTADKTIRKYEALAVRGKS